MDNNDSGRFTDEIINEYIFEVRYKPNPAVLDQRGQWVEALSEITNLLHWRITSNRIDVHDHESDPEKAMERGFVSHKNAGYVIRNCPSGNIFYKKTLEFLRYVFAQENVFGKNILIHRIGAKSRFGTKFDGTFDELLDIYCENYIQPNKKLSTVFGAEVTDIGGYVNFRTDENIDIQSMSGPMEKDQIKQYFPFVESPPDLVLYFEIDSSVKPNEEMSKKLIENKTDDLIRINWSTNNKVLRLLSGG